MVKAIETVKAWENDLHLMGRGCQIYFSIQEANCIRNGGFQYFLGKWLVAGSPSLYYLKTNCQY